ncbi:MAG: ATP-binding cassette domain-containing protein [Actinomycetia bacterium]|nr:ATP-binding cassette domain-containing protein [Actinomycetes bacterium]
MAVAGPPLAQVEGLTYRYGGTERDALTDVSLTLEPGELVAVLGPSGSGKSTLLRALAGLVPHFHGGRFRGSVTVGGCDTRWTRPAQLAGTVASVFQDPEQQIVMTAVTNEVAFGLENLGTPPAEIRRRVEEALELVGALHLAGRRAAELSGGELQRVCLASAVALRPHLILLDEPTSQLDPAGAEDLLATLPDLGSAAVISEQRVGRALACADRVLYMENGRLLLDAPHAQALTWLASERPPFAGAPAIPGLDAPSAGPPVLTMLDVDFAYHDGPPVLSGVSLQVRAGEIVALEGPNGCGKTTLAKLAAGLLTAQSGSATRAGRAGYLSQDPGRYLVRDRVDDEVALAVGGDRARAAGSLAAFGLVDLARRHPRDLSSGERERLGIAAVAVAEPDLLVLDEPTRGVDPVRKQELAAWLAEYAAAGNAVLVAAHDRDFPAHRRVQLGIREVARV